MTSIFREFEIFNSTFFYNWFEDELFNHIANFFKHFQQCLHLYCESKLLDLLIIAFIDSVNAWFDDQLKFISLNDFDIALTKAFFSSESVTIQSIFISSKSSTSQKQSCINMNKQQKSKIKSETSKFKKFSKAKQTVKSTSTLQNIDIFDSTLASDKFEFDLYSEITIFLQHFQQCQHQYRKSDLLNLLSKCLCDNASEWFKLQSKFTSLKRFNTILAKTFFFAETSLRRASSKRLNFQLNASQVASKSMKNSLNQQIVQMNCKICKQSFNFNEKLYEHIRNHETLKLVKNFHLSINAVNLVCEIEKKSFASQKSHESLAKSQKSIFEFAVAFEAVTLLKRSTSQSFALEITSESTKKLSTCKLCKQTFNFKKMFRQHKREQHAKKFVINSSFRFHAFKSVCKAKKKSAIKNVMILSASQELQISAQKFQKIDVQKRSIVNSLLSIDTVKSTCETKKKSTIVCSFSSLQSSISTATSNRIFDSTLIFEIVISQKNSHLSDHTSKTVSKSKKNESTQCSSISSKLITEWFAIFRKQTARIRVKLEIERTIFQLSTLESASISIKKFSI